ncbi:redoxin domain-containing protein [Halolamina sp.]|jgi:peroxiredoxin|uniref:redoxin domain-containing protein n=1 Tax=Halolamina sp. TaxID=1940283 RepID=UPI000223BB45|nr:alkyl hydroperoxide reductase/ Thiol specific antioxidant/ Mal allergen [halophilic archaeon DL31]
MADDPMAVGEAAPTFRLPTADETGIGPKGFEDHLGDNPLVVAFFPAAFSGTCTTELCTFRDRLGPLSETDAAVLGISTDLPWALAEFREQEGLSFPLAADNDAAVCESYGVRTQYEPYGIDAVARRAVFVVDADGVVTYRWLAENPGQEPDYEAVGAAVDAA